jgi:hypothetical protein
MTALGDREIFGRAVDHINANGRLKYKRMAIHGYDAEGKADIEFPTLIQALDWARDYNVLPVVDFRDPVSHPYDHMVLTVSLGDYARRMKLY